MKTQENYQITGLNHKQFYKELGQLLYAVAVTDGKVRKKEVEALQEFLLKEVAPIELGSDSSGMNNAFYAQFKFAEMVSEHLPANIVFSSFINYLKRNREFIDDKLKSIIINAVEKVSAALYNTNKHEQEMIALLKTEIKNL